MRFPPPTRRIAALAALALLTGCSGFFVPETTTTTGTGTGTTTNSGIDYAYVANVTTSTIAGFAIGSGTLAAVPASPYTVALAPTSLAVTPANTFLYAGSPLGGIFGFSIATATGQLTPLSSGSILANASPVSLDVSADGNWLFALDSNGVSIDLFAIDTANGALTPGTGANFAVTGSGATLPRMIKASPDGTLVAAAMGSGGDVIFPFTTATGIFGAPQLLAGSPTINDNALAFDSTTTHLYIARSGTGGGVAAFNIGAAGFLASVAGSPFAAGNGTYAVALDRTGSFLYAANRTDGTLSGFSVAASGILTKLSSSPDTAGSLPSALAHDSSGKYLLAIAAGGAPDLTLYTLDAAFPGKLDTTTSSATGADPTGPSALALTH